MKSRMNIKSLVIISAVGIISLLFINMSFAANTGKISVDTANLRETADENAKILELLSMNQEVEVIEKTEDWYKVKANGMTGYLRQDLITVNEKVEENNTNNETAEISQESQEATEPQETTEVMAQNQEVTQTEETVPKEEKEVKLGKQKVAIDTKLKIVPVINATDTIEVKKDEEVNVIEVINGWVCVEAQTTKGWIRKEKLQQEEQKTEAKTATEPTQEEPQETQQPVQVVEQQPQAVSKTLYVNSATIRVRKEASTSSEIVTSLPINTAVEVVAEQGEWSQVKVNGKEGYISSSLLSATKQETSRSATTPRKADTSTTEQKQPEKTTTTPTATQKPSGKGNTVVATAQQYIGCKYVYGGTSPSGFDCSGFTSYVYKAHGVSLSRTAAGQYSNGVAVSRSDLQPGDLVMFGKSGITHVAIYAGGGKIVHAANSSRGVTTDTINSGYYNKNYVGARRVMP